MGLLGTAGNKQDGNLSAVNIKKDVSILGKTGTYAGDIIQMGNNSYYYGNHGVTCGSQSYSSVGANIIEKGDYIYVFGFGNWTFPSRGADFICGKYGKLTGLFTPLAGIAYNGGRGNQATSWANAYVDGNYIRHNFFNGFSGTCFFQLDTTNDAVTASGGNNNAGTLEVHASLSYGGKTLTPTITGVSNGYIGLLVIS